MKKTKILVFKDKVKRKEFLKKELKLLILKSIFQNFKTTEINRLNAFKKITFFKKKQYISRQNNICLLSGRIGGVFKNWQISRHNMKKTAKLNMLHNIKIHSW